MDFDLREAAAVPDEPVPNNNVDSHHFIRLYNNYYSLVDDATSFAVPLNLLCCPLAPWAWSPTVQQTFCRLKMCWIPGVAHPRLASKFYPHDRRQSR